MVAVSMKRLCTLLSSVLFLLSVTNASAPGQHGVSVAEGPLATSAIEATSGPSIEARWRPGRHGWRRPGKHGWRPRRKPFRIQAIRSGRRYQKGKRYWSFSGKDATIVDDINDAAWFYLDRGQLRFGNEFVSLDSGSGYAVLELSDKPVRNGVSFGRDKDGNVDIHGKGFTQGNGQGSFCVSGDGNIFVVGSKRPPFDCSGIGLVPRGPGPNDKPPPPPRPQPQDFPEPQKNHPTKHDDQPERGHQWQDQWQDHRPGRPGRPHRPHPPKGGEDPKPTPTPTKPSDGHNTPTPPSKPSTTVVPAWSDYQPTPSPTTTTTTPPAPDPSSDPDPDYEWMDFDENSKQEDDPEYDWPASWGDSMK